MSNRVSTPFPAYNDTDGTPLDAGFIFIGGVNTNPIVSPIAIFYDADLTMPAENPARTRNGYIVKNGAARQLFCAEPIISILVQNKRKETVWNSASVNLNPGVTTDAVIDTESGKSQAEINTDTLRISKNLDDLNNKEQARDNLEVYSKTQVDDKTKQATEEVQGTGKISTQETANSGTDDITLITPKKLKGVLDSKGLGSGQKWQDVTSERAVNTPYLNDSGQKITISLIIDRVNNNLETTIYVDDLDICASSNAENWSQTKTLTCEVPPQSTYKVVGYITKWRELRKIKETST
ncbi:hypothetical protein [Acinetobacter bereziniae]|uniref:hypothetical protein n=1 Tax=Acinetobacter bereziniae TaxID=106648 RepID=UPI00300996FE